MNEVIIRTELTELKLEMNKLLESEHISSTIVYQLSVRLDKIIIDYYKSCCKI